MTSQHVESVVQGQATWMDRARDEEILDAMLCEWLGPVEPAPQGLTFTFQGKTSWSPFDIFQECLTKIHELLGQELLTFQMVILHWGADCRHVTFEDHATPAEQILGISKLEIITRPATPGEMR